MARRREAPDIAARARLAHAAAASERNRCPPRRQPVVAPARLYRPTGDGDVPGTLIRRLLFSPDPKLIAGADDLAVGHHDFNDLFALHDAFFLVGQCHDDLARLGVDHFAGRWIRIPTIHAEGDPSWLVAELDCGDLLRRHDGGV